MLTEDVNVLAVEKVFDPPPDKKRSCGDIFEYLGDKLSELPSKTKKQTSNDDAPPEMRLTPAEVDVIMNFLNEKISDVIRGIFCDKDKAKISEAYWLLIRVIDMALAELKEIDLSVDDTKIALHLIIRRLVDDYNVPISVDYNGEGTGCLNLHHARMLVHDCLEPERVSVYQAESARKHVSYALSRSNGEKLSDAKDRLVHVEELLGYAKASMINPNNQGVLTRIADVRKFAQDRLRVEDK